MLTSLVIHPSVVGDSQRYAYTPLASEAKCQHMRIRIDVKLPVFSAAESKRDEGVLTHLENERYSPNHPCAHLALTAS